MKTKKILTGEAAEHYICSELMFQGYQAQIVTGFPYDIILDNGEFHRIQVKSARKINGRYAFARGGNNNRRYGRTVDLYAYLFIDDRQIYFQKSPTQFIYKESKQNGIQRLITK